MPLVTDSALILQVYPYSETSKILRLLTRGHGLVSVMARGALRPKSRYGGVLEPFTQGVAAVYVKENRELQTLGGFELERSRQRLGDDLLRFAGASILAELVLQTRAEAADPDLYLHLCTAMNALEAAPAGSAEGIALASAWSTLTHLGFGPELDRCVHCGAELPEDAERAFFEYAAGGTTCDSCAGAQGRWLPARALADLRRMRDGVPVALQSAPAHWALFDRFVTYHVTDGRTLRSLAFLNETAAAP